MEISSSVNSNGNQSITDIAIMAFVKHTMKLYTKKKKQQQPKMCHFATLETHKWEMLLKLATLAP